MCMDKAYTKKGQSDKLLERKVELCNDEEHYKGNLPEIRMYKWLPIPKIKKCNQHEGTNRKTIYWKLQ